MSRLPLPPRARELLDPGASPNLSLWFDRGINTYHDGWQLGTGKAEFLSAFVDNYNRGAAAAEYKHFIARRVSSLAEDRVASVKLASTSRLVIGLGLPHPTEAGLLVDRLTGCPYLPGSSVKGLLREGARLAAQSEFPPGNVDQKSVGFWKLYRSRIFGPIPGEPGYPASGEVTFYDAFPTTWPTLELDVMTPHYGEHYEKGKTPGDWFSPVPVTFLTIESGCEFVFYFKGLCRVTRDADQNEIAALLPVALDWLGIGAKKSAGYGVFGAMTQAMPQVGVRSQELTKRSRTVRAENQFTRERSGSTQHAGNKPTTETWQPSQPSRGRAGVVKREVVTLVSELRNGVAKVRTGDGQEITCKGFSAYPRRQARDSCLADVTRVDGKAKQAMFKSDA